MINFPLAMRERERAEREIESLLKEAVRRLRRADPKIRAIVLFGSGAYAPHLARDLDLLIVTDEKKDLSLYWEALEGLRSRFDFDLVVVRSGEYVGDGLKGAILAFGRPVWGEVQAVREVLKGMPPPAFEDAKERIRSAEVHLESASRASGELKRNLLKDAFNALFDAARLASMAFLGTEESRWGEIKKSLPEPLRERFEGFIRVLHVRYFYQGDFDPEKGEEAFRQWRNEVERFIKELEETKGRGR